jgi:hypothetical protein
MAVMDDRPTPGERRLDRPPSERFAPPAEAAAATRPPGSLPRAIGYGAAAAVGGAVLTVLLGGVVALSAGLLVVAASAGNVVGLVTRIGGGTTVPRRRGIAIGVALALAGFALGQLGLWWYAGTEGGVLPLVEYLATTFGFLVPIQALLAAGFAWWGAAR